MSMLLSDLVEDLKATLQDAADKFNAAADADLIRLLKAAAITFGRKRPRTLIGTLSLVADVSTYDAPSDFMLPKGGIWGRDQQKKYKPWDSRHPGRLPVMAVAEEGGIVKIMLLPTPSAQQITCLGSSYKYFYFAVHTLSETVGKTTIRESDRDLLLLLATIGAMVELANSGTVNPIQVHRGMGSQAKTSTPAVWVDRLMAMYEAAP